jgi:hypothetical protein
LPAAVTGGMLVGMESSPTERTSGGGGDPTWQRALYELGRDFESLLVVVPACYLNAEAGAPFSRSINQFSALIDEHLKILVSQFDGTELGTLFVQLRVCLQSARDQLRHSWLDEQHVRLLDEWVKAETEFLPDDWWDQIPTHGDADDGWHETRQLIDAILEGCSDSDTLLLTVGRLFTQVAQSAFSPAELDDDGTETRLVAQLRRSLTELRTQLRSPEWLDVDLYLPLIDKFADEINQQTLRELDRMLRQALVNDNGPVEPYWFWWNGCRYRVGQPLIWRLLDHLWQAATRSAEFEELAEHVWQDHAALTGEAATNSARTTARKFFRQHDIPLTVRVIDRRIVLEEIVEQ